MSLVLNNGTQDIYKARFVILLIVPVYFMVKIR